MVSKNDDAWESVFDKLELENKLASQKFLYVTANDLKKYGEREPRLMAKLDTKNTRPEIFKNHDLTIFPVKNGEYVIFEDTDLKSYYNFDSWDDVTITEYTSSIDVNKFQTFPANKEFSESQALDFAYLTSLLRTFTGEDELYLTIRGRLWSTSFNYDIPKHNHTVDVTKVQIEVDAGYESPERIYLIEAKIGKRDNFHIRQLYYPYKDWSNRTTKEIIPIFFTYTNGLYYLTQFEFGDNFDDVSVVKNECFIINESLATSVDLKQLLKSISVEGETIDVPYPQADDLDKVIDIVKNIRVGYDNKFDIASYFDFDERQGDYYANAAIYLGLLKRMAGKHPTFGLTDLGLKLVNCSERKKRNQIVLEQMLKKPTLNESLSYLIDNDFDFESDSLKNNIISSIKRHTKYSGTTPSRRASTVKAWLRWIDKNMDIRAKSLL